MPLPSFPALVLLAPPATAPKPPPLWRSACSRGRPWRVGLVVAAAVLVLAGLQVALLRGALQAEHAARSQAAVRALALAWAGQAGDAAGLQAAVQARWVQGQDDQLRLLTAGGRPWLQYERRGGDPAVPAAFADVLRWSPPLAQAALPGGLQLQLAADRRPLERLLWTGSVRAVTLLALAGLLVWPLALLAGVAALQRWWRSVDLAWQGHSGFTAAVLPPGAVPTADPAALAAHLAASLQGLRADQARQAAEVSQLQRQARRDGVTGLDLRHHFLDHLQQGLSGPQGPAVRSLLIVRTADLGGLNQRLGHVGADRLLASVAQVLLTYVDRVPGAVAGRLNGADFALALPVAGVAEETATALHQALGALPTVRLSHATVVVGGVEALPAIDSGSALAEADAALAHAEATAAVGGAGWAVARHGELVADAAGATAWRAQIAAALAEGRCDLDERPVVDRDGRPLHLDCSLRLQLDAQGELQPAARWWPLARRTQQLAAAEQVLLERALQASAQDRQGRLVRLTATTFHEAGRLADVLEALRACPEGARRLSLDIAEPEHVTDPALLAQAVQAWPLAGARLGVVLAGGSPAELSRWAALGVRFVTLGRALLHGVARDARQAAYVESLLRLARGLGLQLLAEAAPAPDERPLLWRWGLDGAPADDRAGGGEPPVGVSAPAAPAHADPRPVHAPAGPAAWVA